MVVMIYAYESVYCGLHGINTGGVFEVDSVAEADDIGKGMAYDVIDGYSHAFEDYDLKEVEEGIEWEVWPVRDNTGLSVSELDTYVDMLDWQGIIDSDELDELTLNISILESFIRNVKE